MSGLPRIAVIVPTIDGREGILERCTDSYQAGAAEGLYELDLIVVRNEPTCGWGWQVGAEQIRKDAQYIHFTCDDLEPVPGWAAAGIAALDHGVLPAPRVLNGATGAPEYFPRWGDEWADGTAAGFSCVPMITRDLWDKHVSPMLTAHYWTDNWISHRAGMAGFPARVVRRYGFRHWWAQTGRGAGMEYEERLRHDKSLFMEAVDMANRGEWLRPWPPREGNDGKVP